MAVRAPRLIAAPLPIEYGDDSTRAPSAVATWAVSSVEGKRAGWKGFAIGYLGGAVSCLIQVNWLSTVSWLGAILLPLYLWLMADAQSPASWDWATLAPAVLIVLVPLAGAVLAERWIEAHPKAEGSRDTMAWWPVPLLALMVFLIAVAQVGTVVETIGELQKMVPVFVLFLVAAALLAKVIAVQLRLPVEQGRTLAFSMGTRNSFVVLPLALLLPTGWEVAAVVIVVQSLVELFGMVAYVWVIPRYLFR